MDEDYDRSPSPSTMDTVKRLSANTAGDHVRLHRAVIKEDIRSARRSEDEDENDEDNDEDVNDEDDDDGMDPREKIDIGRHPIEFHIYEVWARKHGTSIKYWIYSADYIMENGDPKPGCNEEATRAEAIAHVVEANSYEDPEGFEEKRIELEWLSRGADGERDVYFPEEHDISEDWDENEWMIERDESGVGW